jgi:hypothetical protein
LGCESIAFSANNERKSLAVGGWQLTVFLFFRIYYDPVSEFKNHPKSANCELPTANH